jgi:hypothetical protein
VAAREEFVLAPLQSLSEIERCGLIVRNRRFLWALSIGDHFVYRRLRGFPVPKLDTVLQHLRLAGGTMPAVLLVCFFEILERELRVAVMQFL